jgi:eukaryotic-like serine/threonine-protein kinase
MIGVLLNDRYRMDAELGRGAMGAVYRAHDTLLDRDVAVKVLSSAMWSAEGRDRLLREARSAARLNHPNIVSVYDAGEAEGPGTEGTIPFVVLELVEGPSLHQHPPAGLAEALDIAVQVCAALEHAHAHGLIHRDLKPENVLLAPDGLAKLNDFGLARPMASRMSSDGTIVGTVFYLAPELALGKEFDGRADLYALGIMLYELVTGELPFVADDPVAVISQHLYAPVVPPRAKKPDLPAGLDALIVRLMCKQPADRPASAAEVRAILMQLASGRAAPGAGAAPSEELSLLGRMVRGRLVGREQELAQARGLWQQATSGEGHVLLISGEPGIGKSCLVRELLTQVQVAGCLALLGESYPDVCAPYAPFAQIVSRVLGESEGTELDLPDFVLADLLALAPSLQLRFPGVLPNPALDPQSERQRLFENMVAFCAALGARAPLLLVLEDAHWADSGSLALLHHLARRTRRCRVLIVVTYRDVELDETRPFQELLVELNRERLATRLKLSRLSPEETRCLLAALFSQEITPHFLQGIYREAEGNPFFVEEVCKSLVESGALTFAEGRWHRPRMDDLGIPQSVRMAIQSRVGRLPQTVQETLQLASILGREFEFELLAAASDQGEETLIGALETAENAQLILEVRGRRQVTFAFAHGLIPTTLAEAVHTLRRRRLHRRAAEAIELRRPGDLEALAYHWAAAGDDERALLYCTRAGERASVAYANVEAERYFRAALLLAEDPAARVRLLTELGRVIARQGRYALAIETWQEAIGLCQSLGDGQGVSLLHARSARAAWYAGDTPRGLAICRQGMSAVSGAPPSAELAELLHETGRACAFNGLTDEAGLLCHQALEMAEQQAAVRVQIDVLITLGSLLSSDPEDALSLLARAVDLAETAGLLVQASRAHNNLGYQLLMRAGNLVQAREHFLRAAELAHKTGSIASELLVRDAATDLSLLQGDLTTAEAELPALRELAEIVGASGPATIGLRRTEALLLRYRGALEPAVAQLAELHEAVRAAGDLQTLWWLLLDLLDPLLELGREVEAESVLQEAIALEERWVEPAIGHRCAMCMHRAGQGQIGPAGELLSAARQQLAARRAEPINAVWLSGAEASLAAAEGHWDEAWAAFQAAVDEMSRVGMRWYRARILHDWAEALLGRGEPGDRGRARELLLEAAAEFDALGAPVYARQMEARLEELA